MTLVVARRHGDAIALVSDTHLTDPMRGRVDPLHGAVKSIVMTSWLTVSFANDLLAAGRIVWTCANEWLGLDRSALIERFLCAHQESRQEVEFILAFELPPQLVSIKDGEVHCDCQSAWIGDKNGFEVFQRHLSSGGIEQVGPSTSISFMPTPPGHPSGFIEALRDAMQVVINDAEIPTVGGFPVLVSSFGGVISYVEYFRTSTAMTDLETHLRRTVLPVGDATVGQYSVHVGCGFDGTSYYPLMYFAEARLGVVYRVATGGILRAQRFYANSFDEFIFVASEQTGLAIRSQLPSSEEAIDLSTRILALEPRINGRRAITGPTRTNFINQQGYPRRYLAMSGHEVIACELAHPRYARRLLRPLSFIHLESERCFYVEDVFRRAVFQYKLARNLVIGQPTKLVAYLPIDPKSADRYSVKTEGGLEDLTLLSISGMVTAN